MHVVAVTRWGAPLDGELSALSARLGVVAYDLRMRLAGGLPAIFARVDDATEASEHVAFLRGRGHGAVACDAEVVAGPEDQIRPADFELGATALGVVSGGQRFELPYGDILAMVHATRHAAAEETVTKTEKRLSLGRAVLSGGVMLRKKVQTTETTVTEDQESVIYVFCRSLSAPCVLAEHGLRYDGLGEERQLTTAQNFSLLSEKLKSLAPGALDDDRLVKHKRRSEIARFAGGANRRRLETSNASENDLAAFLVFRAHLEGQL